jgi:TctA family transporter
MPDRSSLALTLLVLGAALVALAALVWSGALSWFGRLPGDIRVERPGMRIYAPITSMIIISIVLTIAMSLFRRFWP